jgi:hypothetical protein
MQAAPHCGASAAVKAGAFSQVQQRQRRGGGRALRPWPTAAAAAAPATAAAAAHHCRDSSLLLPRLQLVVGQCSCEVTPPHYGLAGSCSQVLAAPVPIPPGCCHPTAAVTSAGGAEAHSSPLLASGTSTSTCPSPTQCSGSTADLRRWGGQPGRHQQSGEGVLRQRPSLQGRNAGQPPGRRRAQQLESTRQPTGQARSQEAKQPGSEQVRAARLDPVESSSQHLTSPVHLCLTRLPHHHAPAQQL